MLIEHLALDQLVPHKGAALLRLKAGQEGSDFARLLHTGANNLVADMQIDRKAHLVDELHVIKMAGSAAPAGYDVSVECRRGLQYLAFELPKGLLAILLKKNWNGGMVFFLEKMVGVDKPIAEPPSELLTERGLAAIHIAYEVEVHGEKQSIFDYGVGFIGRVSTGIGDSDAQLAGAFGNATGVYIDGTGLAIMFSQHPFAIHVAVIVGNAA